MVIVLNYNNARDTLSLCYSLLNQHAVNLKITLVDNCSTDDSYKILCDELKKIEKINIILSDRNGGYAAGNNLGLKASEKSIHGYIAILNNDIVIDDTYLLSKLINQFEDLEDTGFISPAQKKSDNQINTHSAWKKSGFMQDLLMSFWLYRKYKKPNTYNLDQQETVIPVDILPGSFLFTDYQFFKSIGYFDEGTFLFLEERILSDKVQKVRRQNYLINNIFYRHEASSTIDQVFSNINKYKILYQSLSYYTKKYRKSGSLKNLILRPFLEYSILELRLLGFLKRIFYSRNKPSKF